MNDILPMPPKTKPVFPAAQRFDTLPMGMAWIEDLLRQGVDFRSNRIYNDFFRKPRSRMIKALGVEVRAQRECQRIAPGGKWTVETYGETHDDLYYTAQAWYSKFAPYAYAMCNCEEGYQCFGIDYESINSFYGSVMGFINMGIGLYDSDACQRIDEADTKLFDKIYDVSCRLHPPSLPFDEAFWPCAVFLAVRTPKLFVKQFCKPYRDDGRLYGGGCYYRHALEVLKELRLPVAKEIPQ
jgi:hypothetical protein